MAGDVYLFHDLDLLHESHIAEEAHDNQQWVVYEAIMKPELRYNAMERLYADGIRQAGERRLKRRHGRTIIPRNQNQIRKTVRLKRGNR